LLSQTTPVTDNGVVQTYAATPPAEIELIPLNQATLASGNGGEQTYSATLNPSGQTDISAIGLVAGSTIAVAPEAGGGSLELGALAKNGLKRLPAIGTTLAQGLGMMLIPSEIGQDPTTYQLDGRDNLRVKYDEDMLSGVIEQQVDGAWESTGQLVTPEYKNDDFFGGIVGFTIADDIPNASIGFPISTPLDSSTQFPALSDRDRQLLDSSGGFQAHEGGGMVILGTPYPTDPSLSAPMPGFPADSGVKPAQVMMNESSESGPHNVTNVPNLTESGTLTNLRPQDPVVLQRPARTLVQDDAGRYWLQSNGGNRITPSGNYDFVTLPDGRIRVARPNVNPDYSTHLGLSSGGEVNYAGSIRFGNNRGSNRGTIIEWSNNSGHYQPPATLKDNANLPVDLFQSR
jgi:hypothetical protein